MDTVNRSSETGAKAAQLIFARITQGSYRKPEDLQYLGKVLVPSLQEAHDAIQRSVAGTVAALAPFVNIDRAIRAHTGSPASFFLPMNVLEDFRDAFAVLVSFLSDVPSMESGILLPLDYLKGAQLVQNSTRNKTLPQK